MPSAQELLIIAQRHHEAGRLDEAERGYARVLTLRPKLVAAWFGRGLALTRLGRPGDAVPCFQAAVRLDARHIESRIQLGALLVARDPDEALRWFERALEVDPSQARARRFTVLGHMAKGAQCGDREDWDAMFGSYRRALALDPTHAGAHFSLAVELLRQGEYEEGWREYEWRWTWDKFDDRPRDWAQPQWRGEPLNGARILLHAEQGLGDAMQFVRYAPLVAARGGVVYLEASRRLTRLFASVPGVTGVVAKGDPLPPCDWQCPLMSLPLAFGTTVETIPAPVPYLQATPVPLEPATDLPDGTRCRVGLVWAGNPLYRRDARRSIALELFSDLTRMDGLRWYSLQVGEPAEALATPPPGLTLVDLGPRQRDLADAASLVASLDLVITVDTSVAHLAGAMGKPVWILVPKPSDWRWLLNRVDSPWYPTARLFRQRVAGDWAQVVNDVRQALVSLVA